MDFSYKAVFNVISTAFQPDFYSLSTSYWQVRTAFYGYVGSHGNAKKWKRGHRNHIPRPPQHQGYEKVISFFMCGAVPWLRRRLQVSIL